MCSHRVLYGRSFCSLTLNSVSSCENMNMWTNLLSPHFFSYSCFPFPLTTHPPFVNDEASFCFSLMSGRLSVAVPKQMHSLYGKMSVQLFKRTVQYPGHNLSI